MYFIVMNAFPQRGIDQALALYGSLSIECRRNNSGKPVAAIAFNGQVFAGQACADDGLELIGSHRQK